jgi:hypothetical protein
LPPAVERREVSLAECADSRDDGGGGDPLFRVLVLRGMAWAAGEPADRWTDLAAVGARISD